MKRIMILMMIVAVVCCACFVTVGCDGKPTEEKIREIIENESYHGMFDDGDFGITLRFANGRPEMKTVSVGTYGTVRESQYDSAEAGAYFVDIENSEIRYTQSDFSVVLRYTYEKKKISKIKMYIDGEYSVTLLPISTLTEEYIVSILEASYYRRSTSYASVSNVNERYFENGKMYFRNVTTNGNGISSSDIDFSVAGDCTFYPEKSTIKLEKSNGTNYITYVFDEEGNDIIQLFIFDGSDDPYVFTKGGSIDEIR